MIISSAFIAFSVKGLKDLKIIFSSSGKDPFELSVRNILPWLLPQVM